ncbi:autotransporter-associated beta strand protein [Haloferula luteola]|uniref:Autotransporter-associated beta strand protein n=1 Tax=Haloferula luteola TaxID=595692 RepID=A0A840V772_9BACT|nr:immunoglobulin domain-containing protein [Haloferula luteola]MBB5351444.1 autotransporter-associated beta strand protein [Haloferula luteola]
MKTHLRLPIGILPLACLPAVLATTAWSAPLVYEGFDYAADFDNLTGLQGGFGWKGAWTTVNNGTADVTEGNLLGESAVPGAYDGHSEGNHCLLINSRRVGRNVDISASGPLGKAGLIDANHCVGADGTTLYVSFLQQPNGTSKYYEFEFHRGNLGDPGRIAGIGNDQGGTQVNLRAPNGTHTPIGEGSTEVNFYVVRIDFKEGNDDVYVYRNPSSLTEPETASLVRLGAADMSFDGIAFGAFDSDRIVAHDEVRMGLSWEDVTVPEDVAPEMVTEPKSRTEGFAGTSVTLAARVYGLPQPSFQWFKGDEPVPGGTEERLKLENLSAADAGDYTLKATNDAGTVTSAVATLEVISAPGGLLAYEGFDYPVDRIAGMEGGVGWGAPWAGVNGFGGNLVEGSLTAAANAPNGFDEESVGQSLDMPNQQRAGRLLDTSPGGVFDVAGYLDENGDIGADGKTLYISFLQQPDGASLFYEFEFHRDDLGDPGRIGGVGNDTNQPIVGLRTGGFTTTIGPGSTGVNFYVVRIDFKEGPDDVMVYQNPVSSTEPGVPTLSVLGASDMAFDGLSMAAFVNNRTVRHDEIRVGQSWSDVVFGSSRRDLVWQGDGSVNRWDFTSTNWVESGSPATFADGDPVMFDDAGSALPSVTLEETVSPGKIVVANDNQDYTVAGSGQIDSAAGLEKSGSGALNMEVDLDLGGSWRMDGGSLRLAGTSQIGGQFALEAGTIEAEFAGETRVAGRWLAESGEVDFSGDTEVAGMVTTSASLHFTGSTTVTGGDVVWLGSGAGSFTSVIFEEGSSFSVVGPIQDSMVLGRDGGSAEVVQNGGMVHFDPTGHEYLFVGATQDSATTASYRIEGGVLDLPNKRLGLALGPIEAQFVQNGGTVNVGTLELGAYLNTGTGIYDLSGGRLNVGGGGITSASLLYELRLGEGTLGALADWSTDLAMTLTGDGEDLVIDTGDHQIALRGGIDGDGGMVKRGPGTLVVTSLNDFTGDTVIEEGTLAGYGSSDFSDVWIHSGARLEPGENSAEYFYASRLSFESGAVLAVDLDRESGYSDTLVMSGPLSLGGATLEVQVMGGGLVPAGTVFSLADWNQGSLSGTFAGLPEGATVSAGANTFVIHYADQDEITLTSTTVASPYDLWATDAGLDGEAGFEEDPDGDGLANGLEWILGGDPLGGVDGNPWVWQAGEGGAWVLEFTRVEESLGMAALEVEYASDLAGPWTGVAVGASSETSTSGVAVEVNEGDSPDRVTVTLPSSLAAQGRLFVRLRATTP